MQTDLSRILSEGESYTVEFKESPDKDLPAEVCAFANASGGKIYIGVNDKGIIVGTETNNNARSRIQDTINKIEPRLNVSLDVLDNIIVLTVPEGSHKPYSCPSGFYLRSDPNSQKLHRDDIIEFIQNEGISKYDVIVRDDLPVEEKFNEVSFKRFIRMAGIAEVHNRDEILINLKCAKVSGGRLCFTNAGALFFRKNDEDLEYCHATVVCVLYKGNEKVTILDTKRLNGDIVSNVDDALIFLKKHLKLSYVIKTLRREEILELPEDALREAVINAVCHRNYFEVGAMTMVEIFDDRVDITNPGGLCKGVTSENFGSISITRNSVIRNLFYRIDYIEELGTGIKRMRKATREANVEDPIFEYTEFFKVTFLRNSIDIFEIQARNQEKLKGKAKNQEEVKISTRGNQKTLGKHQRDSTLTPKRNTKENQVEIKKPRGSHLVSKKDRKSEILSIIDNNDKVTSADLAKKLKLTQRRIRELLSEMVQEGTINKFGDDRYTYYVIKQ